MAINSLWALPFFPDLVPMDLVNSLGEVLNDMKFIEYQHRMGALLP